LKGFKKLAGFLKEPTPKKKKKQKHCKHSKNVVAAIFGLLMSQQLVDEPLMRISVSADSAFVVGRV
jgi:hypothetical protein